jgi:lipid-A-disaccharide synthase-like uncharacterized protein
MDGLQSLFWPQGRFLGIEWHFWKVIGWTGNAVFTSRFLIQWYATEKQGRVVVPPTFWWFSLVGALLLLSYATFYQRDSVFIAAYALSWIPYMRNLLIHHRTEKLRVHCPTCSTANPPEARFCLHCGQPFESDPIKAP